MFWGLYFFLGCIGWGRPLEGVRTVATQTSKTLKVDSRLRARDVGVHRLGVAPKSSHAGHFHELGRR